MHKRSKLTTDEYGEWLNFHNKNFPNFQKWLNPAVSESMLRTFDGFGFTLTELKAATEQISADDPDAYPTKHRSMIVDAVQDARQHEAKVASPALKHTRRQEEIDRVNAVELTRRQGNMLDEYEADIKAMSESDLESVLGSDLAGFFIRGGRRWLSVRGQLAEYFDQQARLTHARNGGF